jgi:Fur family zinc uptake transcriptional regulator
LAEAEPATRGADVSDLEVQRALIAAEALCTSRGESLNAPGRRVLRELLAASAPLKAYDLLGALSNGGRSAAPPTVYRALKFLVGVGLAHRIESLNAYVACRFSSDPHVAGFRLCEQCGEVEEFKLAALPDTGLSARESPTRIVFEAHGLCATCAALSPS